MRCLALRVVPLAGLALGFLLLPRAAAAQSTIAGLVTGPGSPRGTFGSSYAAL